MLQCPNFKKSIASTKLEPLVCLQGVLERTTVTQLLTHKLSSVDISRLAGQEPAQFWSLFNSCFCQVRMLSNPSHHRTQRCGHWGYCLLMCLGIRFMADVWSIQVCHPPCPST